MNKRQDRGEREREQGKTKRKSKTLSLSLSDRPVVAYVRTDPVPLCLQYPHLACTAGPTPHIGPVPVERLTLYPDTG